MDRDIFAHRAPTTRKHGAPIVGTPTIEDWANDLATGDAPSDELGRRRAVAPLAARRLSVRWSQPPARAFLFNDWDEV